MAINQDNGSHVRARRGGRVGVGHRGRGRTLVTDPLAPPILGPLISVDDHRLEPGDRSTSSRPVSRPLMGVVDAVGAADAT
jgi:hypothetical protein